MIPEIVARLIEMIEDYHDGNFQAMSHDPIEVGVPDDLFEGFAFDVREEFETDVDIYSTMTVWELYESIVKAQRETQEIVSEFPEATLVIHLDDEVPNDLYDDLEDIFEKYDLPFAMRQYDFKDGKMVNSPLRRSSDDDIFAYHDKVMGMFQKK